MRTLVLTAALVGNCVEVTGNTLVENTQYGGSIRRLITLSRGDLLRVVSRFVERSSQIRPCTKVITSTGEELALDWEDANLVQICNASCEIFGAEGL